MFLTYLSLLEQMERFCKVPYLQAWDGQEAGATSRGLTRISMECCFFAIVGASTLLTLETFLLALRFPSRWRFHIQPASDFKSPEDAFSTIRKFTLSSLTSGGFPL